MRVAEPRVITLNAEAFAILSRRCEGKDADDYLYTRGNGKPWDKDLLDQRFRKVREWAQVRVRVTIYDFRRLWISEALMAGVEVFTVAKMAGTSVQMIEKTYGHLRGGHLDDAQSCLDQARQHTGCAVKGWNRAFHAAHYPDRMDGKVRYGWGKDHRSAVTSPSSPSCLFGASAWA